MTLAIEKAVAVLQSVIGRTVETDAAIEIGGKRVPPELRIVESKRAIEAPQIRARCCLLRHLTIRGIVYSVADNEAKTVNPAWLQSGVKDSILRLKERGVCLGIFTHNSQSTV